MPKTKSKRLFICRSCGSVHPRWMGKCPDCGTWDALEEAEHDPSAAKDPQRGLVEGWRDLQGDDAGGGAIGAHAPRAVPIGEVGEGEDAGGRLATGIGEFDRVLGGQGDRRGIVPGSVTLVGGEPGIGKSTLLLQAAGTLARSGVRTLYVSSEESSPQVRDRARRLGVPSDAELYLLADTNLARIVEQTRKTTPTVLILDSIQMIYKADLPAAPGSVSQVRRCCAELVYLAKASGIAVVLVGHVTKDGTLAGPRLLEHLVDSVLLFEGDRHHAHRVVRAIKNRFGTTQELGIFEMTGTGLREVPEGASVAALESGDEPRPGSVVCPVMSGSRCVCVELQALTATGFLGAAKRKSSGLDANRLAMLIAVLEQHAELRLADRDIFASVVGGVRVVEPAADLSLLLAIAGSHHRRALEPRTIVVGEVGLGGEVRPVPQLEMRLREAARLGYQQAVVPPMGRHAIPKIPGIELREMKNVDRAIEQLG